MSNPGLQQRQTQAQTLVLAPQLRQGLEVLQATLLELQGLISQEIQRNPVLEEVPSDNERLEIEPGAMKDSEASAGYDEANPMEFGSDDLAALARLKESWTDPNQAPSAPGWSNEDLEARHQYLMDSLTETRSLHNHLEEQLSYLKLNESERQFAELIIGSVDERGYLGSSLDEIASNTGAGMELIEGVLTKIQEMDPPGVAARDLRECLLLQLRRLRREDSLAYRIVENFLQDLAARRYHIISQNLKVTAEDIQEAAEEIADLEPIPGRAFESVAPVFVHAEFAIEKEEGEYRVRGYDDRLPQLRISNAYRNLMMNEKTSPEVRRYILDKIKAGEGFIRNIQNRQSTLYRIVTEIMNAQMDFMENGVGKLRPLTMAEIAEKLGVHETTVSRAVANKYVDTPQGMFEIKYFFTTGYTSADGQQVSNKSIKDIIQQLVDAEDPRRPVSDQAIAAELQSRGLDVARRTIAKYRDELNILSSHQRKLKG